MLNKAFNIVDLVRAFVHGLNLDTRRSDSQTFLFKKIMPTKSFGMNIDKNTSGEKDIQKIL